MSTTEYPPRHLPPFRPLVPGEDWHRLDWTPDMLPHGWRPLLLGENMQSADEYGDRYEFPEGSAPKWNTAPGLLQSSSHMRTRRPLPPPPPTFEHDGKIWTSHVPGDPCPVGDSIKVEALYVYGGRYEHGVVQEAEDWNWKALSDGSIIGYRIPEAKPVNETAKLRERIAYLETRLEEVKDELFKQDKELASTLTPRPIAEAGPVKDGFVRLYGADCRLRWVFDTTKEDTDTHFIDIRLPSPDPRAEYDRAVAEAGGAFEAWLKAKGGVA